jgi:phenylacetate-CoA ligase
MHVYEDHVHVEIFDGDVPATTGGFGDVVVTSLRNRAMPLVRYRVGDRARLLADRCRCGLPHPVMADIHARAVDTFAGTDGSRHHASELVFPLASIYESPEADGIRQIQFEQLDGNGWRVWLERRAPGAVAAGLEDRLSDLVRAVAGADSRVEFRTADDLARVSGKFRYYRLKAGA